MKRERATEEYYPDKVTAQDFIRLITDTCDNHAFIKNMEHLANKDLDTYYKRYPEDWIKMYAAWMEMN